MTLRNPSDRKVCFKIKTTAPKRYCVKPNSGVISAKETVQVAVSLQPFDYDPQEKNRHKFMVQAMYAPEGDFNSDSLWKDTPADQLMDSKLKCVFLLPEGSGVTNGASTTSSNAATSVVENSKQEFHHSVSTTSSIKSSSPKVTYSDVRDSTEKSSDSLKRSVDEIKRLNEEISSLRQENLQLRVLKLFKIFIPSHSLIIISQNGRVSVIHMRAKTLA